jgi:hypothetical protein
LINIGGSSDERIHYADRASSCFTFRDDASTSISDIWGDQQNAVLESVGQVTLKPGIQSMTPASCSQAVNTVPQFRKRHDTYKEPIFVSFGSPSDDASVWFGLDPLGDQIRIKQKIQKTIFLACCFDRFTLTSDPRKGDAAKKSARFPTRLVLRSHS